MFLWHYLGVMLLLPIGGAEAHWVFRRVGGGSPQAMLIVVTDYLFLALALLFFLRSRAAASGVAVVAAMIVVSAATSAYLLGIWPPGEVAYTGAVLSVPLLAVAAGLWRLREMLPVPFIMTIVAVPGTWSIWDLCGFPFETSVWRPEGLPVSWLYPASFLGALLFWWRTRHKVGRGQSGWAA